MDLSIIISTWKSKDFLKKCLDSIIIGTKGIQYEIIVIDNASKDGTVQMIETEYQDVILIKNNRNIGMPARNQGLRIALGRYMLLLDVDTIVSPNSINTLNTYLDLHPDVGLVAAKLTDENGNLQYTCRKIPTVISKFLRRIPFRWAKKLLAQEEFSNWDHNTIKEVDYVIGACQMIRREAYLKVGPIDNNIFYGPEDMDYCLRIWKAGYKVVYNPNAVIIHDDQRITKKRIFSKITLAHIKGLIYFFIKYKYLFSREKIYKTFPIDNRPTL